MGACASGTEAVPDDAQGVSSAWDTRGHRGHKERGNLNGNHDSTRYVPPPPPQNCVSEKGHHLSQPCPWVPKRSAVLFHTHAPTLNWMTRFLRAKMELKEHDVYALLWKDGYVQSRCEEDSLAQFIAGCVTDADINETMQLYSDPPGTPRQLRRNWHWYNCDASFLTYFKLHWAHFHVYDYIWIVEHDLGWTGSLADLLGTYSDDTENDIRCPWLTTVRDMHAGQRQNKSRYQLTGTAHCEQSLVRISRRLLQVVLDELDQDGAGLFCELRAPSACRARSWCKMRSLTSRDMLARGIFARFKFPVRIFADELAQLPQNTSQLYHRVKDAEDDYLKRPDHIAATSSVRPGRGMG